MPGVVRSKFTVVVAVLVKLAVAVWFPKFTSALAESKATGVQLASAQAVTVTGNDSQVSAVPEWDSKKE